MDRRYVIAGAPEVKLAIRVRGMSHEERFFDEQTTTTRVTREFIVMHLRNQVDLDSEVHITNMRTQIGGNYRVAWTKPRADENLHVVGLELLDPEGEIWEADSVAESPETGESEPPILLQCQRCKGRVSVPVPEAEIESLGEGFTISRHCDTCKATTGWSYVDENPPARAARPQEVRTAPPAAVNAAPTPTAPFPASPAPAAPTPAAPAKAEKAPANAEKAENRKKGRAPIRMSIKITRNKYGRDLSDICETINVSRTGVFFNTDQNYDTGEAVKVILPYHPDSVAIPIPAKVVRLETPPGTYKKRVAVHLTFGETPRP